MKYIAFIISLFVTLALVMGLSLDLGGFPPVSNLLDPFRGMWQNIEDESRKSSLKFNFFGLQDEVEVYYDENLIPHIFAENEMDLYRAQGYITARHRLWQMEFQILAASGRVAELVGEQALPFDRLQRRKGLAYGAEAGLRFLEEKDPETLTKIQAYSEGVNAYIQGLSFSQLPVEYKLLGYTPSPWDTGKTLLLLKYMADMLVGDVDVEYTNLRFIAGEKWMQMLFPDTHPGVDPVIDSSTSWPFSASPPEQPEGLTYPDSLLWLQTMERPEPGVGSNNWAVSPSKTLNGHALLANDPHLSLNMPSLWFALQLSTPEFTVKGVSLPGALGVISGFNQDIAWGVTNATRDVRDLYAITFRNDSRTEYLYNDQWMPTTFREEVIKVKGERDFVDTVVYTHYGPIVYDERFNTETQRINLALRWTAHEGSNEQRTFLLLNKGKNHADYLEALNHFTSPAQNFVFASRSGDIAIKVQGKFPLRWSEQGKYIMDGSDPRFEWAGYIPNDHNPASFNPARGFVSSANQHSTDASYPYFMFDHTFEHFRNRRINSRLSEMSAMTLDDMKKLQMDSYHLHASEILTTLLQNISDSVPVPNQVADRRFISTLANWDFETGPEQEAPTLFAIWWGKLKQMIFEKWMVENPNIVLPNDYHVSNLIKSEPESEIFDLPQTVDVETAIDLTQMAYHAMTIEVDSLLQAGEPIRWGGYKGTSVRHLIPNLHSFGYMNIETSGGKGIVNATDRRNGASWRMVVELAQQPEAYGIYPGGQSGNPGSRFYGNFIERWAKGEYLKMNLIDRAAFHSPMIKLQLKPDN